jgi:hypothetical protein
MKSAAMCPATDSSASCKIRALTHFLHDQNMSAAKIHRELCAKFYGPNVMSEGTVREWYKIF